MMQTLERLHVHVELKDLGFKLLVEEGVPDRVYDGVAIRAGVYIPGVGNPLGQRIRIRAEVLRAIAASWKGKKVDMEHRQGIEDEVGVIQDSYYAPDVSGVRQQLRLQPTRPKFTEAIGFIEGRLAAGLVPELSVEFENVVVRAADARERSTFDLDMVGAVGAGTALVTRGACGGKDGCGIGFSLTQPANSDSSPSNLPPTVSAFGEPQMPCDAGCAQKHAELMTAKLQAESARDAALKERDAASTQVKEVSAKLAAAETTSSATTTKLAAAETELKTAKETIQAYKAAEKQALLDVLQANAPKGADLKAVLGLDAKQELKDADQARIETAIASFKAYGAKPAAPEGGGRRTIPGARDSNPVDVQKFLEAKRESMGLSAKGADGKVVQKTHLPRALQRNTDRLLRPNGGVA